MQKSLLKILSYFLFVLLLIISVNSVYTTSQSSIKNIIFIDPGHGGPDGGGVGLGNIIEKDIVLIVSIKLKEYLTRSGYNVIMSRYGDYDLADGPSNVKREDIHNRVKLINDSNCILYVSIHANKYGSPSVRGAQTFYKKNNEKSKELSNHIQEALVSVLKNTNRVAKHIEDKYLIDNAKPVGSLVEIGFITNPEEVKLLTDIRYQEKVAYAIFIGITSFLEKQSIN